MKNMSELDKFIRDSNPEQHRRENPICDCFSCRFHREVTAPTIAKIKKAFR